MNRSERSQTVAFAAIAILFLGWLSYNLSANLDARGITIDYGFLWSPTSFPIGESVISFGSGDTYFRALLAGFLNTLKLALAAIIVSTLLGVLVGLAERAAHPQLKALAKIYVELTRNLPLLLILVVCATVIRILPPPRQAWNLGDAVLLSSRGLYMPTVVIEGAAAAVAIAGVLSLIIAFLLWKVMKRSRAETGRFDKGKTSLFLAAAGVTVILFILLPIVGQVNYPRLVGFNYQGGIGLTPEFVAMLVGLSFYTSGFVAEIVRGGLAAVHRGQTEAAHSLGLNKFLTLYLVLAPQAVRLMLPPLTNQYLNAIKNTTLAVLIGYPDLVSVGNTALNQNGRSIETVSIYLLVYLSLSLATSFVIRRLEKRARLVKS